MFPLRACIARARAAQSTRASASRRSAHLASLAVVVARRECPRAARTRTLRSRSRSARRVDPSLSARMLASSGAGAMAASGAARFDGRFARSRGGVPSPRPSSTTGACVRAPSGGGTPPPRALDARPFICQARRGAARCRAVGATTTSAAQGQGQAPFKAGKDDAARDVASDAIAEPTTVALRRRRRGSDRLRRRSASEESPSPRASACLRCGAWTTGTGGDQQRHVFGTFLLETYNISSFGGWTCCTATTSAGAGHRLHERAGGHRGRL